ncbi:MAG: hypothetical protein ABIE55_02505 [Candidatus Aenigmatarchaeota archaeon]
MAKGRMKKIVSELYHKAYEMVRNYFNFDFEPPLLCLEPHESDLELVRSIGSGVSITVRLREDAGGNRFQIFVDTKNVDIENLLEVFVLELVQFVMYLRYEETLEEPDIEKMVSEIILGQDS